MLHINQKNAVVKYKLNKYFKNGSSILTKCVKTKSPSSRVNLIFGHTLCVNSFTLVECAEANHLPILAFVSVGYAFLFFVLALVYVTAKMKAKTTQVKLKKIIYFIDNHFYIPYFFLLLYFFSCTKKWI